MRSFAIEEPGSPVPALYATLVHKTISDESWSDQNLDELRRDPSSSAGPRHTPSTPLTRQWPVCTSALLPDTFSGRRRRMSRASSSSTPLSFPGTGACTRSRTLRTCSRLVPQRKDLEVEHSEERNAYILMDRIQPPVTSNYMVRPGQPPKLVDVISELGIFGYVIGNKEKIITNKQVGHMLRTKLSHVNEGGVAAGLGALDSLYLVDAKSCCPRICPAKNNL